MIDTDKYEGHQYERMQIDRWHLPDTPEEVIIANANLMNDAPLLLEEVKRLREERKQIRELLAEVLPRKDGVPHMGTILWGLESELKSTTSEIAIILGMAEREEE
tara:strand:- start:4751 stop:5065 length:315 start_codon:yes stop_codon:yes gene_type:complete